MLELPSELPIRGGESVEISLSKRALSRVCGWLFGPTIGWALLLASIGQIENTLLVVAGVGGLVATLVLGRKLAAANMTSLDLRIQ